MNDVNKIIISTFETYSYTRLIRSQNVEFFFIRGINNRQSFDEHWDGRLIEVLGYIVILTDQLNGEQHNYIYLIEDESKNFNEIVKHAKLFVCEISTHTELFNMKNFIIKMTNIYQRGITVDEVSNFMRKVVSEDIPKRFLDQINN